MTLAKFRRGENRIEVLEIDEHIYIVSKERRDFSINGAGITNQNASYFN